MVDADGGGGLTAVEMVKCAVSDDGKNGQIWPKSLFPCIRDATRVWGEVVSRSTGSWGLGAGALGVG